MATNYPGSLDTTTEQPSPLSTTEMDDAGFEHDVVHTNHSGAIIALETKVGTGSSTAVADSVLTGTGSGTSSWSTSPSLAGLSVDTDTLYVDATNNRVGVGTTSPARGPLHLHTPSTAATELHLTNTESGSTSSDGFTLFYDDATNGVGLWMREAGPLRFATNGSEKMRILSGGKVGIGTTTPVAGLDIATTAGDTWTSNGWDSGLILNAASALRWREAGGVNYGIGNSGGTLYFMSSTSSTTGAGADYRMVINSSGNVGIGTTSPSKTLDVNGAANVSGDVYYNNNAIIASYASSTNIDHFWHDDGANAWHFCSDTSYKANGNSELHAGEIHVSGNVVAMYEYHDNVANRSINSNTTLYTKTITTQGNTRLIMQFVTGQFIKSTSVTNLNIRWSMDGFYLTAGDQYLETNHIGYGANNFREQLVTTANTGTLSAGNHTLRVFAESYGNHTVTLNYQGAARSSHVYVWEVCV